MNYDISKDTRIKTAILANRRVFFKSNGKFLVVKLGEDINDDLDIRKVDHMDGHSENIVKFHNKTISEIFEIEKELSIKNQAYEFILDGISDLKLEAETIAVCLKRVETLLNDISVYDYVVAKFDTMVFVGSASNLNFKRGLKLANGLPLVSKLYMKLQARVE